MLITNSLWDILYTHCGCIVFLILKESIMLKIHLIGNVGGPAERRVSQDDGSYFLVLDVAVNSGPKANQRTDWINVYINNPKLIALTEQYISKGTKLYVEGVPSTEGYVNNDGKVITKQKVNARSIEILSSNNSTSNKSNSDGITVEPTGETHPDDSNEDNIPQF